MRRALVPALLVALALAVRLGVLAVNASHAEPLLSQPDTVSYLMAAQHLRGVDNAFGADDWRRAERPPVYPALLAAVFELGAAAPERLLGAVVVQVAVSSLAAGLAWALVRAGPHPGAAVAAGLLVALEPSGVSSSNVVMSEPLYVVVLLAIALGFARAVPGSRARYVAALALLVGAASLVRPVGLYLPLVLGAVLALWPPPRLGRRAAAILVAVGLLPALAWSARNAAVEGSFALSTSGAWGQAIFARQVERVAGVASDSDPPLWELRYGRAEGLASKRIDAERGEYFASVLRAHPATALKVWTRTFVFMLGVPDNLLAEALLEAPPAYQEGSVRGRLRWLARIGWVGAWIALGMAVSLGGFAAIPWLAWRARGWPREARALVACPALLALYHLALGALIPGLGARYRMPAMPFFAVLLSIGVAEALAARRGSRAAAKLGRAGEGRER
jgi:hypothetical protein